MMVGGIGVGGNNPVRVQSMTNTSTLDTRATVEQILRIDSAGAEIVRMTVQNIKEAENLKNIRTELHRRECFIPLVADVHFNPSIAEIAATIADKVRINPGNYRIVRVKDVKVLSDEAYLEELSKAKTAFSRLIGICRNYGTALRIGVNHGSLSPRIINRYGNTPGGMVNSAMEFLHFCREEDFHNVIVSLKSSNTRVMVRANRLMAEHMDKENMPYPLHLGVTEAGEGEDGRIRSVTGIGTLLLEGIGDTIRVSLTEEPEEELPVARKLLGLIEKQLSEKTSIAWYAGKCPEQGSDYDDLFPAQTKQAKDSTLTNPFGRRVSNRLENIGGDQVPVVIGSAIIEPDTLPETGLSQSAGYLNDFPEYVNVTPAADYLFFSKTGVKPVEKIRTLKNNPPVIIDVKTWQVNNNIKPGYLLLVSATEYLSGFGSDLPMLFLQTTLSDLTDELLTKVTGDKRIIFIASSHSSCTSIEMRYYLTRLDEMACFNPVIFRKEYSTYDNEEFQIQSATDFAPLFLDGMGDGLWIDNRLAGKSEISISAAYSILQSTRVRTSKTEFISCPSCGRTMFKIQEATAQVKKRTSHLRGLKIAVMGCIVNGPGEMADADYGYVGSGRGRVSIYKKQVLVKRNVPEDQAIDEMISLIKNNGDWIEP